MRFITTLILIYLCWQLFKWLAKIAIRYWVVKNGGKPFVYTSGFGQAANPRQPTGDVKVDSFGQNNRKPAGSSTAGLGEYVDFEEVK